ncbi:MAG: ABC transporter substrate-binding protein [Desulfobacterales bacterium]|nr:ABC transporter substrate-binding protein [Desulfobacterales bacterium]
MNRRKFIKTASQSVAAAMLPQTLSAYATDRYDWKLISSFPKSNSIMATVVDSLSQRIEQMSCGRIRITCYPPESIKDDPFDAVSSGKIEIGIGCPFFWINKHDAFLFCSHFPFGLNAHELMTWLQFNGGMQLLDDVYSHFNLKVFPLGNTGTQMGGWFTTEIHSVDDFKGLKIRFSGIGGEILKQLGATRINLSSDNLLEGLQSKKIDACSGFGPFEDLALGLHQGAEFYYWPGWHEPGILFDLFMHKAAYDSLPNDLKQIICHAALSMYNHIWSLYTNHNSNALITLVKQHKVTIKRFPDRVLIILAKLTHKLIPEMASKNPLSKKIYDSYMLFRNKYMGWSQVSEEAFTITRSMTDCYL